MGKEIKPAGGILEWLKGVVFGVAKSGAASEAWKLIAPLVLGMIGALGTTFIGVAQQAPGLAIAGVAAFVFAALAFGAAKVQALLEQRREDAQIETVPEAPSLTSSDWLREEMRRANVGRPKSAELGFSDAWDLLRAEEAGLPSRMPFSELVKRVAFVSSWGDQFEGYGYDYFTNYLDDPWTLLKREICRPLTMGDVTAWGIKHERNREPENGPTKIDQDFWRRADFAPELMIIEPSIGSAGNGELGLIYSEIVFDRPPAEHTWPLATRGGKAPPFQSIYDEWRAKRDAQQREHADWVNNQARDIGLREAVSFLQSGSFDVSFDEAFGDNPGLLEAAARRVEQSAKDNRLTIWGKLPPKTAYDEDGLYDQIPAEHWEAFQIDTLALAMGDGARTIARQDSSDYGYIDLRLNKSECNWERSHDGP